VLRGVIRCREVTPRCCCCCSLAFCHGMAWEEDAMTQQNPEELIWWRWWHGAAGLGAPSALLSNQPQATSELCSWSVDRLPRWCLKRFYVRIFLITVGDSISFCRHYRFKSLLSSRHPLHCHTAGGEVNLWGCIPPCLRWQTTGPVLCRL
jgi:hypothetical protein